jgi:hypothetical protein
MFTIQSINTNLINIEMMEMHMHEIFYLFGIQIALFTPLEVHNKRTKNIIYINIKCNIVSNNFLPITISNY